MLKHKFLSALLLIVTYLASASSDEITIGFGEAYKPFAWNENGVASGVQADFVKEILRNQLGLQVNLIACPWRRCQQLVQSGEIDGFFTVPTAERETYTVKTDLPFYYTNFVMHTAKDNPNLPKFMAVKDLADIKKLPNIIHIYMHGSGWHKQELKHVTRRVEIQDALLIPKMLVLKRADLYIEQAEMFRYQANSLGLLDNIFTLNQPIIYEMPWHLFISKQSPHITQLPTINHRLAGLKASGELEKIKMTIFTKNGIL